MSGPRPLKTNGLECKILASLDLRRLLLSARGRRCFYDPIYKDRELGGGIPESGKENISIGLREINEFWRLEGLDRGS
jgi:hypothetical protein